MTGEKNTERLTTCIKHLAVSSLSSISARIKRSCNLIGNCFEMPNVSYTRPLATSVRRPTTDRNDSDKLIIVRIKLYDDKTVQI